jgi:hypothetical protein
VRRLLCFEHLPAPIAVCLHKSCQQFDHQGTRQQHPAQAGRLQPRRGDRARRGDLIHVEEWLSTPIYPGSDIPIHSGMVMQVDVIPSSPIYFSTRMEDGVVIADESLRRQIKERFPECFARCQKRRAFMTDVLGIELADEVLPLANIPAIVPPFFLAPNTVLAMEQ